MENLTDVGVVRSLLDRYGFRFSKALGQNFLINPTVCPRMAEASGVGPASGVLEIGPGKTLSGFFKKTAPAIRTHHIDTADDFAAFVAAWKGETL